VKQKLVSAASVARLFGAALSLLSCPKPALANCQIDQMAEIPVEFVSNQVLANGEINGQPVRVLIDTGSAQSVIWRPAAARLGLQLGSGPGGAHLYGIGGESRLETTVIKELHFGAFVVKDLRIPVAGDRQTDFELLLGDEFWSVASLEFDIKHHALRMLNPKGCRIGELAYWAKTYSMADLIASPRDARKIEVEVRLNGRALRALVDSGAARSVVSKSVADGMGLSYQSTGTHMVGLGTRALESWVGTFQNFSIGDEVINNVQLRIAQLDKNMKTEKLGSRLPVAAVNGPEMLLGADFLQAHRVLIDNSSRKVVFTYEGGPVFMTSESGPLSASTPPSPQPPGNAAAAVAPASESHEP
jgi:predicted aspartyl protease